MTFSLRVSQCTKQVKYKNALHNQEICRSKRSEANPPPRQIGGKILKIGIYTEFRDISDGLYFRRGELNMTIICITKVSNISIIIRFGTCSVVAIQKQIKWLTLMYKSVAENSYQRTVMKYR